MSRTMYELKQSAITELHEYIRDNFDSAADRVRFLDEPHDTIHEIADGAVPVYTYDLLMLAADDLNLATTTPELGTGDGTPVNIISLNVFEALEAALWEEIRELQEEGETCPHCDGDGTSGDPDEDGDTPECPVCDGTGTVTRAEVMVYDHEQGGVRP